MAYSGSCLCGSVKFSFPHDPMMQFKCHCRTCQKVFGNSLHALAMPEDELTVSGNVSASYYHGDGGQLTGISAGATGGGNDQVFFLSDINVNNDFTIPTGRNALAAGPTVVNTGVTVTVSSGSTWTIV